MSWPARRCAARNQWPAGHAGMRAAMVQYFKTLEALGERMLPVLARALDMPAGYFAPFFADEAHINLRFLHYPPQETDDEEQFGQGPHTDNSFITFLAREGAPGLAVRLPSGEWLAPPVIAGTFLVNLGNVMKRWSNDRFLSTPARRGQRLRPRPLLRRLLLQPQPGHDRCLPSCVGPDNPPRYAPAVYGDLVWSLLQRQLLSPEEATCPHEHASARAARRGGAGRLRQHAPGPQRVRGHPRPRGMEYRASMSTVIESPSVKAAKVVYRGTAGADEFGDRRCARCWRPMAGATSGRRRRPALRRRSSRRPTPR